MRFKYSYGYVGLFIILFSSTSVAAKKCELLGKITHIENKSSESAFVLRTCPTTARIEAFEYQWLYEGDRIEILGEAKISASFSTGAKRSFTKYTNHHILEGSAETINKDQSSFYEKAIAATDVWQVWEKLENLRKVTPHFNKVRGTIPNLAIKEDPLLKPGLQYLPRNYSQIAILWRGGSATVIFSSVQDKTNELNSKSKPYLVTKLSDDEEIVISLQNSSVRWSIKRTSEIPTPLDLKPQDLTSPDYLLFRAIWILQEGLKEWQLFALSELNKLSEKGYFPAEELWQATLSGELAAVLQKK